MLSRVSNAEHEQLRRSLRWTHGILFLSTTQVCSQVHIKDNSVSTGKVYNRLIVLYAPPPQKKKPWFLPKIQSCPKIHHMLYFWQPWVRGPQFGAQRQCSRVSDMQTQRGLRKHLKYEYTSLRKKFNQCDLVVSLTFLCTNFALFRCLWVKYNVHVARLEGVGKVLQGC